MDKCCIIGLGLIGGSLGLAFGKYGVARERWGYDLKPRAAEKAVEKGAVDKTGALDEALRHAGLVILSAPVTANRRLLEAIPPLLDGGALVTDTGSAKRETVEAMRRNLPPGSRCVGGHPMAGAELSGIEHAGPDLFRGAVYFLTPVRASPETAPSLMEKIAALIGARPVRIDSREHDRIMAPLSHLPHLAAAALANVLARCGGEDGRAVSWAGRGFKDATRIAAGDPALWSDILLGNADNLRLALHLFIREIEELQDHLERQNAAGLTGSLDRAASLRRALK